MPRVSIGVPVYNGATLIRECLECLAGQTYGDFEVLISDNASTDGTSEICAEFAERDKRFRHVRHETTSDALSNFLYVQANTDGELFLWRAFDDLSSPDYFAGLVSVMESRPSAGLAVARVRQDFGGRKPDRIVAYPADDNGGRLRRILTQMFRAEACWIYGLWRREAIENTLSASRSKFADPWAADHLMLFHVALQDALRGTDRGEFRQRIIVSTRDYVPRPKPGFDEMTDRNRRFASACRQALDEADLTRREKAVIRAALPLYTSRRCHPPRRVVQAFSRRMTGR